MAILVLVGVLAGWSAAQEDLLSLEERVRDLRSEGLYDAARDAVKTFAKTHPELAADSRVKRLETSIRELSEEADRLFQVLMSEARAHAKGGRYAQAQERTERALQIFPERRNEVAAFQDQVREQLAQERMVRIPRRPAWIGSDDHAGEKPLRQVTLNSFLIDKHPVTNEEYALYVSSTGATPPSTWWGRKPPGGRGRHPVMMVTWKEAAAYAAWAGKRLPSAEEWEVAARGADRREFPWGDFFQDREDRFNCNSVEFWQVNKSRSPGTTSVDEFPGRSACGATMGGNVWEWTSTAVPGKVGDRPVEFRILKGGSFMTPARSLRCASVLPENPDLALPDVGFRCAKDAP